MRSPLLSVTVSLFLFAGLSAAVPPEPEYKLVLQAPPATAVLS